MANWALYHGAQAPIPFHPRLSPVKWYPSHFVPPWVLRSYQGKKTQDLREVRPFQNLGLIVRVVVARPWAY